MPARRPPIDPRSVPLMRVRTDRVIGLGLTLWVVAFVLVLMVPALHGDGREWWPWTCLTGVVLGVLADLYVRSGRGDSKGA